MFIITSDKEIISLNYSTLNNLALMVKFKSGPIN